VNVSNGAKPTDMRKQADSLCAVVKASLQEEPKSGHLFVFFNRHRDIVRILFWDLNGYCVVSKRLDAGRFRALEVQEGQTKVVIDAATRRAPGARRADASKRGALEGALDKTDIALGSATSRCETGRFVRGMRARDLACDHRRGVG
jgi:transposase